MPPIYGNSQKFIDARYIENRDVQIKNLRNKIAELEEQLEEAIKHEMVAKIRSGQVDGGS